MNEMKDNKVGKYVKAAKSGVFDIARALEASGIKLDVEKLQTATGAVKAKTEANNRTKVVNMTLEKTVVKAA